MKVALVGINSKYIHKGLAINSLYQYLKANLKDKSFELLMLETSINEPLDKILGNLFKTNADVFCFSTYIWNKELVCKLARSLKLLRPQIKIILGGPEVTSAYLEEDYVDHVVIGEGELPLLEFLEKKETNSRLLTNKENIFVDLNTLPFPYEKDEKTLANRIVYYEGSRGCPFKCTYCLSGNNEPLRLKTPSKVLEDITTLVEMKVKQVKFIDRTFNAHPKWSLEIATGLLEFAPKGVNFHFEVSIDKVSEELLELFLKAPRGLFQLEIGIQSIKEDVLKNIRRVNHLDKIKENVHKILEVGNMHVHTDLIAGLPGDTYSGLKESFNYIYRLYGHMFQVGFLKVIPHTQVAASKDAWGLISAPYPPYEVLKTNTMMPEELLRVKYMEAAIDAFYNTRFFRQTFLNLDTEISDPSEFFLGLGEAYFNLENPLGVSAKFEFLYSYILEKIEGVSEVKVKGLLELDWHLTNQYKSPPKFIPYHKEKELQKNQKTITLPFEYSLVGGQGSIIVMKNTQYLLDYSEGDSVFNYPLMEKNSLTGGLEKDII